MANQTVVLDERGEMLATLEGTEILSTHFGGCVGVVRGQIFMDEKMIDGAPSVETLRALLDDAFHNEFGYDGVAAYLKAEGVQPWQLK